MASNAIATRGDCAPFNAAGAEAGASELRVLSDAGQHPRADRRQLAWVVEDFNRAKREEQLLLPAPKREPLTPEQFCAHEAKMAAFWREWGERPKSRPGFQGMRPH